MSADARRLSTVTRVTVTLGLVVAGCPTVGLAHATASPPAPSLSSTPTGYAGQLRPPVSALQPSALPAVPGSVAPARMGVPAPGQPITFAPTALALVTSRGVWSVPVDPTDTQPDGELALPGDPGRVGWWRGGALAGDAFGSVVVAGHIDSHVYGLGFFARLLNVRAGDQVTLADGRSSQSYSVASIHRIPKSDLATTSDVFSQRVPGRLVLITCTGRFDPAARHYEDNLVVLATPLGGATPAAVR